jgi:hypothetical protein
VKELNKKISGIVFSILTLALLVAPVMAKPTSATNNSKSVSFVWYSSNGGGTAMDVMTNPPWAEGDEVIVTHSYVVWDLAPAPIGNNYVQIGGDAPITIDAITGYEGDLYVQTVTKSPGFGQLNYRVYERIMWGEDNCNYIEIMCLERAYYEPSPDPPMYVHFYASGIFSGHGVIDGQKVQVTGIREGSFQMGIGFVLECYGTIRFAGKT